MSHLTDKLKSAVKGQIKEGDKIPTGVPLKEDNPEHASVDLSKITGRAVLALVPGAWTPPCSSQIPGFIEHADAFNQKGVEGIYVIAHNDLFCVKSWKEKLGANSPHVHFLADDTGAFIRSVGLNFDATGLLGGERAKRSVLIVEGGVVKKVFVEDNAPDVTVTSAENVLKAL